MINLNDKQYQSHGDGESEKELHKKLSRDCKLGIVEIGVLNGDTTKIFCESNSEVPVFGIDPIVPDSMNSDLIGSERKILDLTEQYKNFTFIKDYSHNVVKDFNHKFDYIFIDGDHRYEGVKRDFEEWVPKLEIGGYVALHDSAVNRGGPMWWPEPSRLADEIITASELEYVDTVFTITLFRKIK